MMLYPPVAELVDKIGSRYQLVNLVAKRAREIADELYENEQILEQKPVKTAVEEFAARKYCIVEDPSVKSGKTE